MGFGTYDESEQENFTLNEEDDDSEAVQEDRQSHKGDVEFEGISDQKKLLKQLKEMKNSGDE